MAMARYVTLAIFLAAIGGGCASPVAERPPDVTFAHLPPISLQVRTIEVVSVYQDATTPPNVETRFASPPSSVMQRWAHDRLRATGISGIGRFSVMNAPVTEEALPKKQGFQGAFTVEPEYRYTITVDGQLEILDEGGQRVSFASARVTQSGTLKEGVTADERQAFWARLTQSAMEAFNAQMERAIFQFMKEWTG